MFAAFALNRLQRKVLLIIVVIILAPMLVTGALSALWITEKFEGFLEGWIRDAAQLERNAIADLHQNARLFADVLEQVVHQDSNPAAPGLDSPLLATGRSPVPAELAPLALELGINLVQVYGPGGDLLYNSGDSQLATTWSPGQDSAVVKVEQGGRSRLAAVTILRFPSHAEKHYRLVLGTLFDHTLLERLSRVSGFKTLLFYPSGDGFSQAFTAEELPLQLRLPPTALAQLRAKQPYFSTSAGDAGYFGLYSPVVDVTGRVEAVLFSGLELRGGTEWLIDRGVLTLSIALLGGLLAAGAGLLLGRVVLRPIESLHQAVLRVSAQDFRTTVPVSSSDELGDLAQAFNAMAAGLRQARDEQRREFQRDKLAALGELSMAMAHEIRNPIGVITTASRLLEKARDPERASQLRGMIREESQRVEQLIKDFQKLARHRVPQFDRIDPVAPLEKALQMLLAGREEVQVQRRYSHGQRRVEADPELLRQLWMNLIRNSLEAMGEQGGGFQVGSFSEAHCLVLYLQDSGPGIPVEKMARLFEPFYTTKSQGSGLGLTIANTLAQANGAFLELLPDGPDGSGGRGACFALRMSCPEEEAS